MVDGAVHGGERGARARDHLRYPVLKSATIPLCHLAQEQDGHLTEDAMEHIAELLGLAPAEVLGTASFYEMFKREPVGKYVINVCTSISCFLNGGDELLEHAGRAARHQGRRHDRRRPVHDRGLRVHRRVHRGAVPAGQLPLLPQDLERRVRPVDRRSARRAPHRHPAARHARAHPPAHRRRALRRRGPSRPRRAAGLAPGHARHCRIRSPR